MKGYFSSKTNLPSFKSLHVIPLPMTKGQIISGEFGKVLMRQKAGAGLELGELLISEHDGRKIILQVYDLLYGSQLSQANLELMSGMKLEELSDLEIYEPHLRNYKMALLKSLLTIDGPYAKVSKTLPEFFSEVREVRPEDLHFLAKPKSPLFLGRLRSGSKEIATDIFLEGDKVLSEHILIPATTGRGKSNLTSCMLWDCIGKEYAGILVLDPHDEYYGRNGLGMKDHPDKGKVAFYSTNPPAGGHSLKINLKSVRPRHFDGAVSWTDAQKEALAAAYRKFKENWIEELISESPIDGFQDSTLNVVRRRLLSILSLKPGEEGLRGEGAFDPVKGESTIGDICSMLEEAKIVIIDTSSFSGAVEILIGSLIAGEAFSRYKRYKAMGCLASKPQISIVLEEAPRVLGKDVIERGSNIFGTIAREGRKFKVGLIAITQLPSLIPREILANMNTKIILGIEMAPERQAIIDSASQDLSDDSRSIASLDKGEAIITSNFTRFAIPVKVPYFPDVVKAAQNKANKEKYLKNYSGIRMNGESPESD
jgi:DNA helicase HerA-like ATPase